MRPRPPGARTAGSLDYLTGPVDLAARSGVVEFGYYILNTYVPELDGSAADVYSRYFEQVEAAEAVGFEAVWATEHHFRHFGGLTPNPPMLLTAISHRT